MIRSINQISKRTQILVLERKIDRLKRESVDNDFDNLLNRIRLNLVDSYALGKYNGKDCKLYSGGIYSRNLDRGLGLELGSLGDRTLDRITIHFRGKEIDLVCDNGKFYISLDGNRTWKEVDSSDFSKYLYSIDVLDKFISGNDLSPSGVAKCISSYLGNLKVIKRGKDFVILGKSGIKLDDVASIKDALRSGDVVLLKVKPSSVLWMQSDRDVLDLYSYSLFGFDPSDLDISKDGWSRLAESIFDHPESSAWLLDLDADSDGDVKEVLREFINY